jgi:hypothetical protein
MDEFHLHGPTALASIIGQASMETRVGHGAPGGLGAWLQERCRQGFDLPEAEHVCRRIYYQFDGIPMALRAQLSRATLAALFAELARLGWIHAARGIPVPGPPLETRALSPVPDSRQGPPPRV